MKNMEEYLKTLSETRISFMSNSKEKNLKKKVKTKISLRLSITGLISKM